MWFPWNFDPTVYLLKNEGGGYFCPLDLIMVVMLVILVRISIIEFEETWTHDLDIEQKDAVIYEPIICSITFYEKAAIRHL